MKFLFNNNLPPSLARGMAELSKFDPAIQQVTPLRDKFAPNAADADWLPVLAEEGGWIVISIDRFRKSDAERELLRRRGLTVFVLDRQWSSKPYWVQAAQFVLWWPKVLDVARLTSKTAMRVPWRFTNRSTFEQIRS